MDYFLMLGLGLGLSAGFAPGPLTSLIITESLHHGTKNGVKVALAPFVTDTPIILFSLLILLKISSFNVILGLISLVGGTFLFYLGLGNLRLPPITIDATVDSSHSLTKGILANFLSPNPYLFWISVGGPIIHQATILETILFLTCFYGTLVSIKIGMAVGVGRSRSFLSGPAYRWITRVMGIILWLLALLLYRDGIHLLWKITP